jgi:cysteine desulfurase
VQTSIAISGFKRHGLFRGAEEGREMKPKIWLNNLDGSVDDPAASVLHDAASESPESVKSEISAGVGSSGEIILCSSVDEASNHAIKGIAMRAPEVGRILVSTGAPLAIRNSVMWLTRMGWDISDLDSGGDADIIAVEMVNHETGVIRDISAIRERYPKALLVVEASAAVGRIPISSDGIDALALGFDGFGALVIRKGLRLDPLIHGGGEQGGRRGGHLPEKLLSGFSFPSNELDELDAELLNAITEHGFIVNADGPRAPGIINFRLPGISAEAALLDMARKGVVMSPSSGCTASTGMPSRTLLAMGLSEDEALTSVRISLGPKNSTSDIIDGIAILSDVVAELQG